MRYLKLFKVFSTQEKISEDYNIDFTEIKSKNDSIAYTVTVDGNDFLVIFSRVIDNVYSRSYKRTNVKGESYSAINANPYKIIETITEITKDFIKKHAPSAIIISHIPTIKDKEKINKRAKLSYRYLKNIDDYKLNYFNDGTYFNTCILSKINFNIKNLIDPSDLEVFMK